MNLEGSVGLLTGASRGIGIYLAEALARKGVRLALAARSADELEETAKKVRVLGADAIAVPADVTKRADLKRLVARTTKELGPIDLLVNNAGIDKIAHFATLDPDVIESMFRLNVIATETLTRFVVPGMIERRHGHIVNISSLSGKVSAPYMTVYSSTKHAVVGFSWSLRAELEPYGIGVSVVCPTYVTTGLFMGWNPSGKAPRISAPVSGGDVAAATIRAIERNRAEVIVARGPSRIADVSFALSPDGAMRLARRAGAYSFLRKAASKHSQSP